MVSWSLIAWIALGVAALVLEGIALFNSTRGDTLSEHLWVWLGLRGRKWKYPPKPDAEPITPIWTVRVARTVFVFAVVWFGLHIATGGWV